MDARNNDFDFDFTPIGQAIKKARTSQGMTREQLARIVDYDPRHLQANHFGIVGDALCPILTGVFLARLKDNNFLCVLVHIDTVRFPFAVLFKLRCFGYLC